MSEEQKPTAVTNEQMKQMIEVQMRLQAAGMAIGDLTDQVQKFMLAMTSNNPRLIFAVVNELQLMYAEILRRAMHDAKPEETVSQDNLATEAAPDAEKEEKPSEQAVSEDAGVLQ